MWPTLASWQQNSNTRAHLLSATTAGSHTRTQQRLLGEDTRMSPFGPGCLSRASNGGSNTVRAPARRPLRAPAHAGGSQSLSHSKKNQKEEMAAGIWPKTWISTVDCRTQGHFTWYWAFHSIKPPGRVPAGHYSFIYNQIPKC